MVKLLLKKEIVSSFSNIFGNEITTLYLLGVTRNRKVVALRGNPAPLAFN